VHFGEGTKAFEAGDFRRAAQAFEAAYRLGPNTDVLWNAARAWHRAGESARAATLYARYLRDAPPEAPDRAAATAQLASLTPKVARIEFHGPDSEELMIDDVACEDRVVYVSRGSHVMRARVFGRPVEKNQQVEAGDVVSVVFDAQGPRGATGAEASPSPATSRPAADVPRSRHRGVSPWIFASSAALTGVAVAFTIASGVDTDNALTTFNAQRTEGNLSIGQGKQLRTNVLLGTSIGLGAWTAASGIWLVDWHHGQDHAALGLLPGGGEVRWSF
jgi:hypothetical protein